MPASAADMIAKPGDPDLVIDLDGLTISSVVTCDDMMLVGVAGGWGWWITGDGSRFVRQPGEDSAAEITEGTFTLRIPDEQTRQKLYMQLTSWRDRQIPLRMCGAPGRHYTLIEDNSTFVVLPNRPLPRPDR